jgi:hypothetical protein
MYEAIRCTSWLAQVNHLAKDWKGADALSLAQANPAPPRLAPPHLFPPRPAPRIFRFLLGDLHC